MNCQRCGGALRQGQAMCVACGTPTGMYLQHQGKGVGCVGLIVGFLVLSFVLAGAVIGLVVASR